MKKQPLLGLVAVAVAVALLAACGSSSTTSSAVMADAAAGADAPKYGDSAGDSAVDAAADAKATPAWPPTDCDDLMPSHCGLPWPSNLYLQPDTTRKTGFALRFGATTLPGNTDGVRLQPADYAILDGYSIGSPLMMYWPDLDPTGLPGEASLDKSLADDAPFVLLEVGAAGVAKKLPYFAEVDMSEPVPAQRLLLVRPAVILQPATRYVVAVRGLKDKQGKLLPASAAFSALAKGTTAGTVDAGRQSRFDDLFGILAKQGVAKDSLQLAWDFVTNSDESLHARVLSVREQGYKAVGEKGPELKVTSVESHDKKDDPHVAWTVKGTFKVPNFMYAYTPQYMRLKVDASGVPVQDGWIERPFLAQIPRSAVDGKKVVGLLQYGHGLNGSVDEIGAGYLGEEGDAYDTIVFGCNMSGMSQYEVGTTLMLLTDMSNFSSLSDRLETGVVESILLQRAMRERFADLPEIKALGIQIDKSRLFYSGNSQGGIFGGTVVALSEDVTRGHLGVPGNNYSLLLQRSSDFVEFFEVIKVKYPSSRDRLLLLSAVQLLWDQTDPITWYRHLSAEPLPGTPAHRVLMVPAKGDYQVAVITNEILARSGLDIHIMKNYGKPVFGVAEQDYPFEGSGIVLVDAGNPWPAPGNLPPADSMGDPHGTPRKLAWVQKQMFHFFKTGEIKDVCGGDGCKPD